MPRLLMIAHDHLSPGGAVAARFAERGYDLTELLVVPEDRFHEPGVEASFPDPRSYDVLLLLGAPWSAYGQDVASWVPPEVEMLRQADQAGVPVLGICFGGQLLATAHGGSVHATPAPEIGLHAVHSPDPVFDGLWFEWHVDRFVPPPGGVVVARNAAAPQAFVLRRNLGLQFHPEVDADGLEGWLSGGGRTQAERAGLDPDVLIAHVRANDPAIRARAAALVDHFLDRVATGASYVEGDELAS